MNNDNELAPDSLTVDWNDSTKQLERRLSKVNGWRVCKLVNGEVVHIYKQQLTEGSLVVMPNTPIADNALSADIKFIAIKEDEEYKLAIADRDTDWSKFKFPNFPKR